MALGTREVLLVIRAKDQASRIISDLGSAFAGTMDQAEVAALKHSQAVGAALVGVGVVMAGTGALIIKGFLGAAAAGREFENQVALVQTQTIGTGISLQDLQRVVEDVGKTTAVPLEGLNRALYDIFSSMNVNLPQSKVLLEAFAKAAVSGQVDIQDASRATIALMNAYQLPIEDVNHVLDIQFQMVKVGVGTYGEFATAIGRAIPAAVASGQSIESLAGMLAFLTRNGLSADMAATSAARAMELLVKPTTIQNLADLGVNILDANGNLLQMSDIVTLLANGPFKDLTDPQRAEMFKQIFGTGSVQARRFFDVAIPNFQQLNDLTGQIANSTGAMNDAYDIMSTQGAAKVQILQNRLLELKITIWDDLKPALGAIALALGKLLDAWDSLSPRTQKIIILTIAAGAAFMVIVGIVLAVIGAFIFMSATLALVGTTIGAVAGIVAIVLLVLAALVAAGILVYQNWDTIKQYAGPVWDYIYEKIQQVWQIMQDVWAWIVAEAPIVWQDLQNIVQAVISGIGDAIVWLQARWQDLQNIAVTVFDAIVTAINWVRDTWAAFVSWFNNNTYIQDTLARIQRIWNDVFTAVENILSDFQLIASNVWTIIRQDIEFFMIIVRQIFDTGWAIVRDNWRTTVDLLRALWNEFFAETQAIMTILMSIITNGWNFIYGVTTTTWNLIWAIIKAVWDEILVLARTTWEAVSNIIEGAVKIITGIINLFSDFLHGRWGAMWDDVKQILSGAWQILWGIVDSGIHEITGSIEVFINHIWDILHAGWTMITATVQLAWWGLESIVRTSIDAVVGWVEGLPGRMLAIFENAGSLLYDIGKKLIQGMLDGITAMFDKVKNVLSDLKDKIFSWKGPPEEDAVLLVGNGGLIMQGLIDGMAAGVPNLQEFLQGLSSTIVGPPLSTIDMTAVGANIGDTLATGLSTGLGNVQKIWDDAYGYSAAQLQRWKDLGVAITGLGSSIVPITTNNGAPIGDFTSVPMMALGGVSRGLAIVGERGPELVNLGSSSSVFPTDQFQKQLGGTGGTSVTIAPGAVQITIQGNADNSTVAAVQNSVEDALSQLVDGIRAGSRK